MICTSSPRSSCLGPWRTGWRGGTPARPRGCRSARPARPPGRLDRPVMTCAAWTRWSWDERRPASSVREEGLQLLGRARQSAVRAASSSWLGRRWRRAGPRRHGCPRTHRLDGRCQERPGCLRRCRSGPLRAAALTPGRPVVHRSTTRARLWEAAWGCRSQGPLNMPSCGEAGRRRRPRCPPAIPTSRASGRRRVISARAVLRAPHARRPPLNILHIQEKHSSRFISNGCCRLSGYWRREHVHAAAGNCGHPTAVQRRALPT